MTLAEKWEEVRAFELEATRLELVAGAGNTEAVRSARAELTRLIHYVGCMRQAALDSMMDVASGDLSEANHRTVQQAFCEACGGNWSPAPRVLLFVPIVALRCGCGGCLWRNDGNDQRFFSLCFRGSIPTQHSSDPRHSAAVGLVVSGRRSGDDG